jgi:1-acyl-sn-glycerol-3-phosphate acyltransferase
MIYIRSIIFNIYFPLWTYLLAICASPFYLTPQHIASKIGYVWSCGIMIGLRCICNIKYEIHGEENLPEQPYVIACKHQSAWDTAIFLKHIDGPAYILKKSLMNVPLFGRYLKTMCMIPVDRDGGSAALKQLQKDVNDRLEKKRCVVIFPEGTRTAIGEKVKYQPGIAFIYKELSKDIKVVPVALNSGKFWGKNSFLKYSGTIQLHYLKPIEAGLDRKEFITKLEDAIETKSAELVE